jgi:Putative beta barrel porin-7 (BBP7)
MGYMRNTVLLLSGVLLLGVNVARAQTEEQPHPPESQLGFINAESLIWFINHAPLRTPLVTTASGTPDTVANNGSIGQSGTRVLVGGDADNPHGFAGFRITAGTTTDLPFPVEVSGFYIEQKPTIFSQTSDSGGSPVLARPIFASQAGVNSEVSFLSSFPGLAAGHITVDSLHRLWGTEGSWVYRLYSDSQLKFDTLVGFRYLDFTEQLNIDSSTTPVTNQFAVTVLGTPYGPGNTVLVNDHFGTRNQFYGGQVGARAIVNMFPNFTGLTAEFTGKVAFGVTNEYANINGLTTLLDSNGGVNSVRGGLLATPSNIGNYSHNRYSIIPQGTIKLGYDFTSWAHISVGYDFLYWQKVLRPGDLVNRTVDTRQVPSDVSGVQNSGATQPSITSLVEKSFWAQGASIGLTFTY